MRIREANPSDLESINAIYNEVLLHSTAIYSDQPMTLEERECWFHARRSAGFPVLVGELDARIAGFATYGEFRSWPGYRYTVEGSVHIEKGCRRSGVGRALLDALVARARAAGMHRLVAAVDAENAGSLAFLGGYGFTQCGRLPEVGCKFGRFLDLVLLVYPL